MSAYSIDAQAGLALSASWRHPEVLKSNITQWISHVKEQLGAGVIWHGDPLEPPVILAKAGIQSVDRLFPKTCGVDSRFRGNDCGLARLCLANDTTRRQNMLLSCGGAIT